MAKIFKRFKRDKKGVTAIEFALIAAPFFALLISTIELALVFWANGVLIEAVSNPSHTVLVGLSKSGGAGAFHESVCEKAKYLMDCNKLIIDVRSFKSFSEIESVSLVNPKNGQPSTTAFDPGQSGDIVVVRVGYQWQLIMPIFDKIRFDMSSNVNGTRLIQSSNAFKNE
jgi:Flp pilus assembly protein TadG